MEKLTVTLEDRPVDIELAQYKRMFEAACSALAAIGDALGVDPEEGGAEPILAAIADLKAPDSRPVKQEPVAWIELLREARDNCKASIAEEGISATRKEYRIDLEARLSAALDAAPVSAKREWVDLTDDEIWEAVKNWNLKERVEGNYSLTRAVIAAFKEKNK